MLLALFTISCETVVQIDLPETESLLTVNCLFQQDSAFFFTLSASKGILESGELEQLNDGQIKISASDGTEETISTTSFDSLTFREGYISTMKAKPGVTYTVTASRAGYESVTATAVIPEPQPVSSIDTTSVIIARERENHVLVSLKDPSGIANYYEVKMKLLLYYPVGTDSFPYVLDIPIYPVAADGVFGNSSDLLFSDELFDGQEYAVRVAYSPDWVEGDTAQIVEQLPSYLIAELRSVSEDYFKFQQSYNTFQFSAGDPFAQPVQVYNNVEGGYGIVAGYSIARDTIPFK